MTSVLVVDDEPALGKVIQRDLDAHGYDAHLCTGAEEALGLLARISIDVLLTDLRMTGVNGMDLLQRVRQLSARTRAILMSGHATARDYQRAIELGAVRVLCKPFTADELVHAVRQAADCELGFWGRLHGLSLTDVLQMLHYSRRAILLVVHGPRPGRIYFRDGQLFHAESGPEEGEAALRAILTMPAGMLATEALPPTTASTITRPFEVVLLDSVRTLDEEANVPVVLSARGTIPPRPALTLLPDIFAAHRNGAMHTAVDVFDRARRPNPESEERPDPPLHWSPPDRASQSFDRGMDLLRRKDLHGALIEWQRAVELEPENRTYRANLRRLERLVEEPESK
jgi:CheY-like chemotaxis protein